MRKVIEGKVYDTDKAEELHYWDNDRLTNDFRFRSKTLYRTKKGAFFILHSGGAMTDMAKAVGSNSYSGSDDIEPVSEHDALRFLESHGGAEVILERFADKVEEA